MPILDSAFGSSTTNSVPRGNLLINVASLTIGCLRRAIPSAVALTFKGAPLLDAAGAVLVAADPWAVEPLAYLTYHAATYPSLLEASRTLSHWPCTPTLGIAWLAGSMQINVSVTGMRRINVEGSIRGCVRKESSSVGTNARAPGGNFTAAGAIVAGLATAVATATVATVVVITGVVAEGEAAGCPFVSETYHAATYP